MTTEPAEELRRIERLLDERVGRQNVEDWSVYQRVEDVIGAWEGFMDLAIRRLHELHRVQDSECESCGKYLDGDAS